MRTLPRRARTGVVAVLLPVVLALVLLLVLPRDGTDAPEPARRPVDVETVDVVAAEPHFASLDELAGASDLVVVGTIATAGEGRVVTDPASPDAGVRTVLLEVDVEQVVAGQAPDHLVLEHEAALLDGTPITVNGIAPPPPGEHGLYFLLAGGSDALPYHALIGSQGRYPLTATGLAAVSDDPIAVAIARMGLEGVLRALDG